MTPFTPKQHPQPVLDGIEAYTFQQTPYALEV